MINAMNSGMSMPPPPPRSDKNLTEDQQQLITDTLSKFDPENMSQEDALSIIETLSEADIEPGGALESIMSDLGFDAKSIGDLAMGASSENRPPPPPQSTEEITSMVSYLTELMEDKIAQNDGSELSDEDKQSIMSQVFEKFNIEASKSIINTSA